MKIKRYYSKSKKYNYEYLVVSSSLYFDDKECFCVIPYMTLHACKEIDDFNKTRYQIKIGVRDWDDFDIGYIYTADSEKQFFDVLHELINWMNDLEHGVAYYYEDLIEDLNGKKEFFPNHMGCKREGW